MSSEKLQPIAKRFRPAVDVKWAKLLPAKPDFIRRTRSRGKYAVGVRYEREVHDHLSLLALAKPNVEYLESPWLEFCDENGKRWCQADGVMLDRAKGTAIVAEVKIRHTADAWWQLSQLYIPVLRKALPQIHVFGMLEIVHWFDPATEFPEKYDLTDNPFYIPHANKVAVHIFNPRRRRPAYRSSDGLAADGHNVSQGAGQAIGPVGLPEGAK